VRLSIAAIWAALALLAVHLGIDLKRSHDGAMERGKRLAITYVRLVAEHAAATFNRADLILERAVLLPDASDVEHAHSLSPKRRDELQAALIALQAKARGVVSMTMTDQNGIVFANTVGTPPGGSLGDRGYFLTLKNSGTAGPVISEVIKGRVSNRWGVQIARRITLPDGGFGGMVVANVGMTDYMEKFYESLSVSEGTVISLRDMGHRQLVRFPSAEETYGKVVLTYEAVRLFDSGEGEGSYVRDSSEDGVSRFIAVKKLPNYDIYALVGFPVSELLGSWVSSRNQAAVIFGIALIAALAATVLSIGRARLHQALRTHLSFHDALFDTLPIPVFARNKAGGFVTCNKAYETYFGASRGELEGKSVFDVFEPDLARQYHDADLEVLRTEEAKSYQTSVVRADGVVRQVTMDKACYRDADGQVAGVVATVQDVTDRENMERELWRLATTDPLTGVGNRRYLLTSAEAELGRRNRHDRPLGVIAFDLDHCRRINDTHGHRVGDEAIQAVANCCTAILRDEDIVGRMGGGEFAIVLPETDLAMASEVARRLHGQIGAIRLATDQGGLGLTASFGVTQLRRDETTIDEGLRRAAAALHEAKESGRNRVVIRD
jgi:diguanylate cyclase (GGDEF)-like protein/PAS domain S-box-containing protein